MEKPTHVLIKNGEELHRGTENECYFKLQRIQSRSADWAIKHEGYTVEPIDETPVIGSFDKDGNTI